MTRNEIEVTHTGARLIESGRSLLKPFDKPAVRSVLEDFSLVEAVVGKLTSVAKGPLDRLILRSELDEEPSPVERLCASFIKSSTTAKLVIWVTPNGNETEIAEPRDFSVSRWTWLPALGRSCAIHIGRGSVRISLKRGRLVQSSIVKPLPVHRHLLVSDAAALAHALLDGLMPMRRHSFGRVTVTSDGDLSPLELAAVDTALESVALRRDEANGRSASAADPGTKPDSRMLAESIAGIGFISFVFFSDIATALNANPLIVLVAALLVTIAPFGLEERRHRRRSKEMFEQQLIVEGHAGSHKTG